MVLYCCRALDSLFCQRTNIRSGRLQRQMHFCPWICSFVRAHRGARPRALVDIRLEGSSTALRTMTDGFQERVRKKGLASIDECQICYNSILSMKGNDDEDSSKPTDTDEKGREKSFPYVQTSCGHCFCTQCAVKAFKLGDSTESEGRGHKMSCPVSGLKKANPHNNK